MMHWTSLPSNPLLLPDMFNLDLTVQGPLSPPSLSSGPNLYKDTPQASPYTVGKRNSTGMLSCYRPQRSWGKAIFSQACVILFTGCVPGPGECIVWGVHGPGVCVPGLGDAWSWGVCMVPGGCAWSGGSWLRPPEKATAAGGTHPTGMHSC